MAEAVQWCFCMNQTVSGVLVVESDQATVAQLRDALNAERADFSIEVAGSLSEGLERLQRGGIDIILLDLMLPDSQGFETFARMSEQAGSIPIIVLSQLDDASLALRVVREGAQDYLVKGRMNTASLMRCVRHALERHRYYTQLLHEHREKGEARILNFLGVKGGVGTTTVCLNVAAALAQSGKKVIAVETGLYSSFSLHLQVSPALHSGDLLNGEHGTVEPWMVEKRLTWLPFGFRVLLAPPKEYVGSENRRGYTEALFRATASLGDITMADMPSSAWLTEADMVRVATFNVIVVEPEPLAVEAGREAARLLESWGVPATACGVVVVNRLALRTSVPVKEIREYLGFDIVGTIPPCPEACATAARAGKLLFFADPGTGFSVAMRELADNLSQSPVRTLQL